MQRHLQGSRAAGKGKACTTLCHHRTTVPAASAVWCSCRWPQDQAHHHTVPLVKAPPCAHACGGRRGAVSSLSLLRFPLLACAPLTGCAHGSGSSQPLQAHRAHHSSRTVFLHHQTPIFSTEQSSALSPTGADFFVHMAGLRAGRQARRHTARRTCNTASTMMCAAAASGSGGIAQHCSPTPPPTTRAPRHAAPHVLRSWHRWQSGTRQSPRPRARTARHSSPATSVWGVITVLCVAWCICVGEVQCPLHSYTAHALSHVHQAPGKPLLPQRTSNDSDQSPPLSLQPHRSSPIWWGVARAHARWGRRHAAHTCANGSSRNANTRQESAAMVYCAHHNPVVALLQDVVAAAAAAAEVVAVEVVVQCSAGQCLHTQHQRRGTTPACCCATPLHMHI